MSRLEDLREKIVSREARLGVIGLGYVGLPLAVEFAKAGFRVTGFDTDGEKAYLEQVDAEIPESEAQSGFRMTSDTGEVNLATNDFVVTGNVIGSSEDGGDFTTDWVRYNHEDGTLYTDAPVIIVDDGITYRGVGFQYDIDARRFRLGVGNDQTTAFAGVALECKACGHRTTVGPRQGNTDDGPWH